MQNTIESSLIENIPWGEFLKTFLSFFGTKILIRLSLFSEYKHDSLIDIEWIGSPGVTLRRCFPCACRVYSFFFSSCYPFIGWAWTAYGVLLKFMASPSPPSSAFPYSITSPTPARLALLIFTKSWYLHNLQLLIW